jgi:hypothetical protein
MVNVHESDYEQYNEYSFHFGLLFFRFLRIEQTDLDQFVGHVGERLAFLQPRKSRPQYLGSRRQFALSQ